MTKKIIAVCLLILLCVAACAPAVSSFPNTSSENKIPSSSAMSSKNEIPTSSAAVSSDAFPKTTDDLFVPISVEDYEQIPYQPPTSDQKIKDIPVAFSEGDVQQAVEFTATAIPTELYNVITVTDVWPIDEQRYLVKTTYAPAQNTLSDISVWDTEKNTRTNLWTAQKERVIQDIVATPNYYYWAECGHMLTPKYLDWKIYQYNRATGKIRVVLSYENTKSIILPRLAVYGETLLFKVGEEDAEENVSHYLVEWNPETEQPRKLFRYCYVINPYLRAKVLGDYIYSDDYTDRGVILRYNLKTGELEMFTPDFQYENECIMQSTVTENAIYYTTNHNVMYKYSVGEEATQAVLNLPHSIGAAGNHLIFTRNGSIYCLPDNSDTYYRVMRKDEQKGGAHFFSFLQKDPIILTDFIDLIDGKAIPHVYRFSEKE